VSPGSYAGGVDTVSQVDREGGHSQYPPTQDTEREIHLVTTATPFHVPNHHPALFMDFSHHQEPLLKDKDSGGTDWHPPMTPASSSAVRVPSTHLLPQKMPPAFSEITSSTASSTMVTPPRIAMVTPHPELPISLAQGSVLSKNNERSTDTTPSQAFNAPPLHDSPAPNGEGPAVQEAVTPSTSLTPPALTTLARRDGGVEPPEPMAEQSTKPASEVAAMTSSSGDVDEETTMTTIITTTIITTTQTPVPCSVNLTAPEGYIEVPPPSGAWYYPIVECTFTVTVYMGYGVEIQVLNVSLLEGETVALEDLGGREPSVVANESILMKGLVVRSRSNQIAIRFQSDRPRPGSFLLRYQAFVLSCVFPQRPAYGDVSVTSLHAGGEAYFYCFTGYQIQGPPTLTCRNATTPYWSGKEPQCLAVCGGMVKNATVGRIVSPGFPSNYSNNLTCHWVLEAPAGHRLHVHFEKVALAEDDD
ncbi:hypothetical protein AGOR_G00123270, partial [Albula goreensis]